MPGLIPVPAAARSAGSPATAAALAEVAAAAPLTGRRKRAPKSRAFTPTLTRQARAARPTPTRPMPAQRSNGRGTHPRSGDGFQWRSARHRAPARRKPAARARRTPAETLAVADRIKAARPAITDDELAAEAGHQNVTPAHRPSRGKPEVACKPVAA